MANPYSTLGISRSASEAEIKSAYRQLAKQLHPDRNRDNPAAAARFSQITGAYDLLSDKAKRAAFDRGEIDENGNPAMPHAASGFAGQRGARAANGMHPDFGSAGSNDGDLSDLFEGLFGRGGPRAAPRQPPPQRKGANIAYRLAVPFIDAALSASQRLTLADGKTIDIALPEGVEDGTQLRLKDKGRPGLSGPGDGLVTIEILPHPFFVRDGDDVRIDLPITLNEAVAGAKVRVPTADGPVLLTVSAGSSSGKILRLKGRGFTRKGGGRGDQLVTLQIVLPDNLAELAGRLDGWQHFGNVRSRLGV